MAENRIRKYRRLLPARLHGGKPSRHLHRLTPPEVQRAMGFRTKKTHPEVAPSQFEINTATPKSSTPPTRFALHAICRQVQQTWASPIPSCPSLSSAVNGSGMTPMFQSAETAKILFWDPRERKNRKTAGPLLTAFSRTANDICLLISQRPNAYRRLDPHSKRPTASRLLRWIAAPADPERSL